MKGIILGCRLKDSCGYAFVTALLAMLVLTAIGVLVFTLTSRNLFTTARLTFEKNAMNNAESVTQNVAEQIALLGSPKDLVPGDVNDSSSNKIGEFAKDTSLSTVHMAKIPGSMLKVNIIPYKASGIHSSSGVTTMINVGITDTPGSQDFE
ncbi:MAG TPA: hypothetical protein VK452_00430 [Dissulfurispiraceae bacterium]|nr:hypothetical protein [Dissulfurispiraceae bacterium]